MTGPDDVSVPDSQGPTNLGTKTISDLAENLRFTKFGDTIEATGSLKTIKDPWTEFDSGGNNTGHFLPIKLPEKCKGKQVTCKGRVGGDRTVTIDDDLMLITRLENLTGTTITLEMDGATLATIDISNLIPVGAAAYNAEKTDFGRFGKTDALTENFSIKWKGAKGKATGKIKYLDETARTNFTELKENGNYLPIGLSDWYGDGIPKKAGINNIDTKTAQDIVFKVTGTDKPVVVTYLGKTVMEIDLSGMTLDTQAVKKVSTKRAVKKPAKG